jgi:hypothetical protein
MHAALVCLITSSIVQLCLSIPCPMPSFQLILESRALQEVPLSLLLSLSLGVSAALRCMHVLHQHARDEGDEANKGHRSVTYTCMYRCMCLRMCVSDVCVFFALARKI